MTVSRSTIARMRRPSPGIGLGLCGIAVGVIVFVVDKLIPDLPAWVLFGSLGAAAMLLVVGLSLELRAHAGAMAPDTAGASATIDRGPTGNVAYGPQTINYAAPPAPRHEPAPPSPTYRSAVDDLLDELASIRTRVAQALRDSRYGPNFILPAHQYTAHKDRLPVEVRAALRDVYVRADHLNREIDARGRDRAEPLREDHLEELVAAIDRAETSLGGKRLGDAQESRAEEPSRRFPEALDIHLPGRAMEWVGEDPRRWKGRIVEEVDEGAAVGVVFSLPDARLTNADREVPVSLSLHACVRLKNGSRWRLDPVVRHEDDLRMPINLPPGSSVSGTVSFYLPHDGNPFPRNDVTGFEIDVDDHLTHRTARNLSPLPGYHRLLPPPQSGDPEVSTTSAIANLKQLAREHANVKIVAQPGARVALARRIAYLFESATWAVNLNETPQERYSDNRVEGIEVSGFDEALVRSVILALETDGIRDLLGVTVPSRIHEGNPKYDHVVASIRVTVGH